MARRGSLARAPGALKSHNAEKLKGGTLCGFSTSILSQNMKKLKKTKVFIFGKKSHNAEKKLKGGTLWDFSTSILSQNIKKNAGGPFEENFFFRKKSLAVPKKNEKGESLVSPGMVCYAEKQEKPFWFSSLDQIVHVAIIFCRTFVELFWSVRVDRKKRVTILVAFHFMKRRLKRNRQSDVSATTSSCGVLASNRAFEGPSMKGPQKLVALVETAVKFYKHRHACTDHF